MLTVCDHRPNELVIIGLPEEIGPESAPDLIAQAVLAHTQISITRVSVSQVSSFEGLVPADGFHLDLMGVITGSKLISLSNQLNHMALFKYTYVPDDNGKDKEAEIAYAITSDPEFLVIADPNCFYSVAGSIKGVPFGIKVTPWCIPAGTTGLNSSIDDQWALGQIGYPSRSGLTGSGVAVGLLDSSPLASGHTHMIVPPNPASSWPLRVVEPTPVPPASVPGAIVNDHGLFAASLVHKVAGDSEITIIRVLDDALDTDSLRLEAGINWFISDTKSRHMPAVMNMSLQVLGAPPATGVCTDKYSNGASPTLISTIQLAISNGMVVVAGAGNDSSGTHLEKMGIPAALADVIGVGATNKYEVPAPPHRSCFSNCADMAAPGGEGRDATPIALGSPTPCAVPDEDEGVVGLISAASSRCIPSAVGYRYARWSGTSFSAPWVAGSAALHVQANTGRTFDRAYSEAIRTEIANKAGGPLKATPPPGNWTIRGVLKLP